MEIKADLRYLYRKPMIQVSNADDTSRVCKRNNRVLQTLSDSKNYF